MLAQIVQRVRSKVAPPPTLKVSEWANRYRFLSPEASAEPGRFDINRTPYFREIVNATREPSVSEIWLLKSSQVAYSENLNNLIGYHCDQDPCPIMMIQPTLEMAESYSKDRISPMIRDTPALRALIDDKSKTSGNTILHKTFPGGFIQLVGANSPASLASRPIRLVIADEVDRFPASASKEGDPISLARRRQTTFFNSVFIAGGSPTIAGASRVVKGYEQSDKRLYMVPCPRCGVHIDLRWPQFQADKSKPNYGQYHCQECSGWIEEHERFEMIKDAETGGTAHWRASNPLADQGKRGYFIWSAYSPWMTWTKICDLYNEAKGDHELEVAFWNTVLGLAYSHGIADLDPETIFRSRESYGIDAIPNKVVIITAGVDTQDDRFEVEVVGWGIGEESWSLDYRTIDGDPEKESTRRALDEYLQEPYTRADGREMTVRAAFIDSGGHRTDSVYKYTRGKSPRHIYACKGSNVAGQPIFARLSPQKKQRVKIAIIGTDTAKDVIYARLAKGADTQGRCHFPLEYGLRYFEELCAEEKVVTYAGGQAKISYRKKEGSSTRNEPLDCRVYALAALRHLNPNLRARFRRNSAGNPAESQDAAKRPEITPEPEPTKPPKPSFRRPSRNRQAASGWMS